MRPDQETPPHDEESSQPAHVLDGLQLLLTVSIGLFAMRGEVSHSLLLVAWALLPMLRALGSGGYRRRWRGRVARSLGKLDACAEGGAHLPWRAAVLFVGLPVLVLALANGRKVSCFDNLPTNLMAASVVLEGDIELSEYTRGTGVPGRPAWPDELPYCLAHAQAGVRSVYPAGNLTFAVPSFALAQLLGGDLEQGQVQWRLARWTATLLAASSTVLFLFLALQLVDRRAALWGGLMFGLGSATLSTLSQGLFSQTGVTFWILVSLLCEFRREVPGSWARAHPHLNGGLQCIALGSMFACRLTSATYLLPFGVWLLVRDQRRAALVTLGALLVFAPWAWLYWSTYGSPLGPQLQFHGETARWSSDPSSALVGLLLSPSRGLFVYQPWLLLPLAWLLPSRGGTPVTRSPHAPRGWQALCLGAVLLHIALIAAWGNWWGGHSWGSRLLAETLPCAGLLVLPSLSRLLHSKTGTRLVLVATSLGILMQANEVLGPGRKWNSDPLQPGRPLEERLWDWTDPPFLYPLPRALRSTHR